MSGSRLAIVEQVKQVLERHLDEIRAIAPDAQVGFRGSLARGFKGAHKKNAPFGASRFDVDAFIVSDQVEVLGRPGGFLVSKSVRSLERQIHRELAVLFPGLKGERDRFSFRIVRSNEAVRKFSNGDVQVFVK